MKPRHMLMFLLILIVAICITACITKPPISETSNLFTPNTVPSETILTTLSPTVTSIPIPIGSGLVSTSFEIRFLANFDTLPSNEYIIVRLLEDTTSSFYKYRYISIDGQESGDLFSISGSLTPYLQLQYSSGSNLGFVWQKKDTSGMLFIDLENQKIEEFNSGCDNYFSSAVPQLLSPDGSKFAYSCNENNARVWYIVSRDDWSITGYLLPLPSGYNSFRFKWVSDDLALLWDGNQPTSSEHVCLWDLTESDHTCLDSIPNWIELTSQLSPDGEWLVSRFSEFMEPDKNVVGILPSSCLLDPLSSCSITTLPEIIIQDSHLWVDAYWSPDGSKIAVFSSSCFQPWLYTMDTQLSKPLGDFTNVCLDPGPGPWTANGDYLLLIDKNPSDNWKVWLVSTVNGDRQRIIEDYKNILDVIGLFWIP